MNIVEIINKKRLKEELTKEEINYVITGFTSGDIKDYQMSSLLMAICINNMSDEEIFNLTDAMLNSGDVIDLTGATVFFTVKRNLQDTDAQALISKTITSHSSPSTGETSITFTSTDVDYVGDFYYDVKIKDSAVFYAGK